MRVGSALLLALALAGCVSQTPLPEDGAPATRLDESLAPVAVSFAVVTRSGGPTTIGGLAWWPSGDAETVLLAIHGSGGVKEHWGPMNLTGYSFAHREVALGRAVVAIDTPGYNASRTATPTGDMMDRALVADQVADALRAGSYQSEDGAPRAFPRVVGVGHSLGALTLDLAQGELASFDAIIPTGWAHGEMSAEFQACLTTGPCPSTEDLFFWTEGAAPDAVSAVLSRLEAGPDAEFAEGIAFAARAENRGALDAITARIDVPVLDLLGDRDALWNAAQYAQEASHYPGSSDVTVAIVPDTGHFLFHHLSHDEANAIVEAWLEERGF